jgi:hypothetical protein
MPDNATIYIADPSLLGAKLFKQMSGILSCEGLSQGSSATGIRFKLQAGEVTINFMPQVAIEQHLRGFSGYAEQFIVDRDKLPYVLSRIKQVRFVLGCVIEPGFDKAGKVHEFLFQFTALLNGILFLDNTIFDYDGEALGGPLAQRRS